MPELDGILDEMGERDEAARAKEFSDRVYFNTVVILKGVTLAFGASTLLGLIRHGAPFDSANNMASYLAWLATSLVVTLSFTSQAFGSARSSIHPTTMVVVLTFALGITEFVTFGLIEPRRGHATTASIEAWLMGMAVAAMLAFCFVSLVLTQLRSDRYFSAEADQSLRSLIRTDRRGALVTAAAAICLWAAMRFTTVEDVPWIAPAALMLPIILGLRSQPRKMDLARPVPPDPEPAPGP